MTCTPVKLPNGRTAIVCAPPRRTKRCKCGAAASRECDWKTSGTRTCSKGICDRCTYSPGPEKDLCPKHAEIWKTHPANPANRGSST